MAKAYYGSKISPNIIRTPEEFLICQNVPIARTGTQKYLGRELGITDKPDEIFTVYRTEEEVFKPAVMASFEGKPFTDEHPDDWVTPQNAQTYMKGSTFNVRRGSGKDDIYLVADIIVYNQSQIDEIEGKIKREISCGYECEYVPYKDGFKQVNIIGNHVALVSAGRAGSKVAIKDNKNNEIKSERSNKKMGDYRLPRRAKASDFLKSIGLKVLAQDAEPEDVMEAVDELVNEKIQAEKDAEPIIIEKQAEPAPVTEDEDLEEVKGELAAVKDAINQLLARDDDPIDEPEDEGMEAIDAFEEELNGEVEDEDMSGEIASVEEEPEVINGSEDAEEVYENRTTDSVKDLLAALRPLIANIPDKKERKRAADNLVTVLKKQVKDSKIVSNPNNVYAKMNTRTHDSGSSNQPQDLGMIIAKMHNPSYKEK